MNVAVSRDVALEIERVEAAAWRDMHASALPADRAALGLRARELAGAFVMAMDRSDSLLQNRVIGLGLDEPVTGEVIDTLLEQYRDHANGFAINLCPFAAPAGLESLLGERGFGTFFHHLKWVRGTAPAPAPATELRVEAVPVAQALAWGELASRVHGSAPAHAAWASRCVGRAGWSHYFAYAGDTPVAVAALFVAEGAAWLGAAATLESHRRQGAQGALFARRIGDAREQGARRLTVETAPDWPELPGHSLRNAARAGFHPAYERPSWVWPLPR
ncbi:MAG TPA: GNAT family N-acetyltransferase [Candidatus Eisenbacteria bacterium]